MENNQESLVEIHLYEGRHLPKQYLNLVRSRWSRSYKHSNAYMKLVYAEAYYNWYSVYIMHILNRPNTVVRLAMLADDLDVILGFSVIEGDALHYVEVKGDYRRMGIGRNLVPEKIVYFSHITKIGARIWATKAPYARFNPFV